MPTNKKTPLERTVDNNLAKCNENSFVLLKSLADLELGREDRKKVFKYLFSEDSCNSKLKKLPLIDNVRTFSKELKKLTTDHKPFLIKFLHREGNFDQGTPLYELKEQYTGESFSFDESHEIDKILDSLQDRDLKRIQGLLTKISDEQSQAKEINSVIQSLLSSSRSISETKQYIDKLIVSFKNEHLANKVLSDHLYKKADTSFEYSQVKNRLKDIMSTLLTSGYIGDGDIEPKALVFITIYMIECLPTEEDYFYHQSQHLQEQNKNNKLLQSIDHSLWQQEAFQKHLAFMSVFAVLTSPIIFFMEFLKGIFRLQFTVEIKTLEDLERIAEKNIEALTENLRHNPSMPIILTQALNLYQFKTHPYFPVLLAIFNNDRKEEAYAKYRKEREQVDFSLRSLTMVFMNAFQQAYNSAKTLINDTLYDKRKAGAGYNQESGDQKYSEEYNSHRAAMLAGQQKVPANRPTSGNS